MFHLFATTLLMGVLSTAPVALKPFDHAAFDAAQKQGASAVVIVAATWCPVCRAQEAVLRELQSKPEFSDVTIWRVDFDDQTPAVQAFKVSSQSTIIAFKAGKEIGRWVGDTNREHIVAMVKRTQGKAL